VPRGWTQPPAPPDKSGACDCAAAPATKLTAKMTVPAPSNTEAILDIVCSILSLQACFAPPRWAASQNVLRNPACRRWARGSRSHEIAFLAYGLGHARVPIFGLATVVVVLVVTPDALPGLHERIGVLGRHVDFQLLAAFNQANAFDNMQLLGVGSAEIVGEGL